MTAAIVAMIMSLVELIEQWTGYSFGIGREWVETLLEVATPILIWLVPGWFNR